MGNLPRERSEGSMPFNVVKLDFAGLNLYRGKGKVENKGYIILYTCALTRGLHLEFLKKMNCDEFLKSLKRFIGDRGRPAQFMPDNGKSLSQL